MKNYIFKNRSFTPLKGLLLIFLGSGFWSLQAQNTTTDIIPPGSTVTKLSTNQYIFTEGPVWLDSVLLFTDDFMPGMGADIYQFDPIGKQFIKWPTNAAHCTGLTCDRDGNVIGVSANILMMNKAGQLIKTLATGYNGKPFNNPNDLIADGKGGVYFTDPNFFLTNPPQNVSAIYYIDSTGNVRRAIEDLALPNGLVLSPDGKKLYAVESANKYVYSWDVAPDGSVSGKLILAELQRGPNPYADGMAVDIHGNIYVATEKGVQVFSPQGTAIATIVVPETPSNCDFGGSDFKTLYITAHANLYSIDLNYPGYAVSRNGLVNSIHSIPMEPTVEIYPNPAGDFLEVHVGSGVIKSIEIAGMDGKMESVDVKISPSSGAWVNTQPLLPGIYLMRLVYDGRLITRRFIKE
jgi:gluconolactonase